MTSSESFGATWSTETQNIAESLRSVREMAEQMTGYTGMSVGGITVGQTAYRTIFALAAREGMDPWQYVCHCFGEELARLLDRADYEADEPTIVKGKM